MDTLDLELIQKEINEGLYNKVKTTKITKRLIDELMNIYIILVVIVSYIMIILQILHMKNGKN